MKTIINEFYRECALRLFGFAHSAQDKKLEILGLDSLQAVELSKLDGWGQHFLARRAPRFMTITVDPQALIEQLRVYVAAVKERELEDVFLQRRATQKMMRELFGMHSDEFTWRRRQLGMFGVVSHRPSVCDKNTELKIWRYWHDHQHLDIRSRWLKTAELSGQYLNIIWDTVKKYDKYGRGNEDE